MVIVKRYMQFYTPKMRVLVICTAACATLFPGSASALQNQRFPAPLGLNKVLSGAVVKAKVSADSPKDAARYLLKTDDATYQLHGHEKELSKLVGKKVRVTRNAAGEYVTGDTVERLQEK
jgi:hypothetical protein